MRRIFGGSSITSSSTSNSLASDALPSPVGSTSSSQLHQPPPILEHNQAVTNRIKGSSDGYENFNSSHEDEHRKPGWFGAALVGGLPRSNSSSSSFQSQEQPPTSSSQNLSTLDGASSSRLDDLDTIVLPFGAASTPPPRPDTLATSLRSPVGVHSRTASRSTSWQYPPGSDGLYQPFSPGPNDGPTAPKDSAMLELLSGQAVIEAKDYKIMDWDEMQEAKKEHTVLAARIASLTRTLSLESRLRDSAAKLVRLSAPASPSAASSATSPGGRTRVTREQAEAQVATANAKIDSLSAEIYRLGWKEAELRTKLLRHTAGALGAALRRKEEDEASAIASLHPSVAGSERALSPFGVHARSSTAGTDRFDGAHFFAGNKEAVYPHPRAQSPYASPQLGGSAFAPFGGSDDTARVRDLESKVEELERALHLAREENAQNSAQHESARGIYGSQLDQLRNEVDLLRQQESETRDLHSTSQRGLEDTRHTLNEAQRDLEAARQEVRTLQGELEAERHELQTAQDTVRRLEEDAKELQTQLENAGEQAKRSELDLADHEHKVNEAESRLAELEVELQQSQQASRQEGQDQPLSHPVDNSDEVGALLDERRKTIDALSTVLQRYRDTTALAPVLRGVPFDLSADVATGQLDERLADTLESHFSQVADHVEALSGISTQHETLMARSATRERELSDAQELESQLRQEVAASQEQSEEFRQRLEQVTSERDSEHSQLEQVWRTIPSSLGLPIEHEEDFMTLQRALEAREPGTGSFTISSLVERIKALLAQDTSLVSILAEVQREISGHREKASSVERDAGDVKAKAAAHEHQIQQLEERMNVSAEREASMLERLNDLTESLEQTRGEKRKLEGQLAPLRAQVEALEAEKSSLATSLASAQEESARRSAQPDNSAQLESLQSEVQELKDQLSDVMEELDEAKAREAKTRGQLLDELSSIQSELSSTKTKLRAAERKVAAIK